MAGKEERLGDGIVVAVADAAHGGVHAGLLAALIGVVDDPRRRPAVQSALGRLGAK